MSLVGHPEVKVYQLNLSINSLRNECCLEYLLAEDPQLRIQLLLPVLSYLPSSLSSGTLKIKR